MKKILFLLLLGGVAGFVNGLLGSGGGVILLLGSLLTATEGSSTDVRDRFAGTALVTMLLSAVSAILYFGHGKVALSALSSYLFPALAGGALGAYLLDRLPTVWAERLFAILTVVGGGLMLFR
jgi:uncharacterized membrane protein YfcA